MRETERVCVDQTGSCCVYSLFSSVIMLLCETVLLHVCFNTIVHYYILIRSRNLQGDLCLPHKSNRPLVSSPVRHQPTADGSVVTNKTCHRGRCVNANVTTTAWNSTAYLCICEYDTVFCNKQNEGQFSG